MLRSAHWLSRTYLTPDNTLGYRVFNSSSPQTRGVLFNSMLSNSVLFNSVLSNSVLSNSVRFNSAQRWSSGDFKPLKINGAGFPLARE